MHCLRFRDSLFTHVGCGMNKEQQEIFIDVTLYVLIFMVGRKLLLPAKTIKEMQYSALKERRSLA